METKIDILMVDDHPENLLTLEAVLSSPDYRLIGLKSGEDALRYTMREDMQNVAVILLDVQMPGMNGFETAKLIKNREKTKDIPIIFITAINKSADHVLQGYQAGSIDYMFKPFHPDVLKLKVDAFVKMHRFHQNQYEFLEQIVRERTSELIIANEERVAWEKEMAKLARLNLIGEMAAGIAHEIRNPMTTIRGFLQMSKKNQSLTVDYIDIMLEELNRANGIITEFLSLAKNKTTHLKRQNLNEIIASMEPLIQAEAMLSGKHLHVHYGTIDDLQLDDKEIRQLILNMAINGLEAMSPGGAFTISTYTEGKKVILKLEDQGSGIKEEYVEKLGTPFFTTKETGTGLGLAVCYSIAARHKAEIELKSGDKGTVFFIKF
ncbi:hybrid sensor histidine kinase/response regulator [Cohnella endophytica]|uniref:histidine kinase n=1 Tax=Cohnella endophytica TaxID=2419778 RepID=A0A494XFA6_9BACL|nr:response regulator [Cohnella endophytica]RKP46774.1 hybrid sensor histidine kinase/response regulator [Cohnella endophytica]